MMQSPHTPASERLYVLFDASSTLVVRGWQNADAWSKKLKTNTLKAESLADAHDIIRQRLGAVPPEAVTVIETGPGVGTSSQAEASTTTASFAEAAFVRVENDRGAVERKAPDPETVAALRAVGLWPA